MESNKEWQLVGASVRDSKATYHWTSATSWAKLVAFMTRVSHDIIHMVTSFPCRKATMPDGRRASMNWVGMVRGQTSEPDYILTSETRVHGSGEI